MSKMMQRSKLYYGFANLSGAFSLILPPAVVAKEALLGKVTDHFHWRQVAPDSTPRPWAIILPGVSGLRIFDDDQHYFRFAQQLNRRGIDVLVVDYRQATRYLPDTRKGLPGPRIAKIVGHAMAEKRHGNALSAKCRGVVIGWSLGGEGMWDIAASPLEGLSAAIGYYPSVRGQKPNYRAAVPVLVLQGGADSVTKPKQLETFLDARNPSGASIRYQKLPVATHGFDVTSLGSSHKNLRFDKATAEKAESEVSSFLESQGLFRPCNQAGK